MAVAAGYYTHSAITAIWASILAACCLFQMYIAYKVVKTSMVWVTPGVLLYAILVLIESVDFEGLYGIYSPVVPAAIRILQTDVLACCSFGAMHIILCFAYLTDNKEVPPRVVCIFIAAAVVKMGVGVVTAIAFLAVKQKRVLTFNDVVLLATFCVSMAFVIRLVWRVQSYLATHLSQVPSETLAKSLIKMRRILVVSVFAVLLVPGFLMYNILDHYEAGTSVMDTPDPTVYRLGYSVWFKLIWASFLVWLARPTPPSSSEKRSPIVARLAPMRVHWEREVAPDCTLFLRVKKLLVFPDQRLWSLWHVLKG